MIAKLIEDARKIVIKFGSNTLANKEGKMNTELLAEFADQIAALVRSGKQIIIVSSGAQVAGLSILDKWARKKDIHYRQALCAIGQVELMGAWRRAFEQHSLHIGQILLTREDFKNPNRTLNMRNTLFTLVDEGIIPIINENDTVSVEEINSIGDNDTLAADSAILWSADLLIIFTDEDGVHDKNPKEHSDAVHIEEVWDIDALRKNISIGAANNFGTGGLTTKIDAAQKVIAFGIPTILADGGKPHALVNLAAGKQKATAFLA